MLALFIWKDQKKQLELPEAKASIWPGIPPMCPTIDHGTLVPSAFHGAAPVHFLQNGSWPLQLFTESTTLISQALIVIIYSHPPVLRNCLPEHIIFFFFLQGAVPIPEQALFFCLKPSYLPGPSCQFQGQAWWIKLVLAIITQGWFDFLGNPLAWYCPVCVIPTNSISIGCWQMLQRVGGGCCNQIHSGNTEKNKLNMCH